MKYFFALAFLFSFSTIQSQNKYDLIAPGVNLSPKCANCVNTINTMPSEVSFGVQVDEFSRMYFVMTDIDWFNQLFKKSSDGLSVDILVKSDFECGKSNTPKATGVSRGTLTEPIYLKEMKDKMRVFPDGRVVVDLGLLPSKFRDQEFELNLILLAKSNVCHYTFFYNIKRYKWDLLDMGLYTDTVIFNDKKMDSVKTTAKKTTSFQYKKMNFMIPFEKNKSTYTKADILPIYDSLSLNLYDIKTINIRAYSSVEGSKANNIILQEKRAKSIIDALQEFQSQQVTFEIASTENWVEFYQDIKGTEFESLSGLSKEEVKQKLDKDYAAKMESILSKHRKAIVEIEIEKKTTLTNLTEEQIQVEFKKSIENKDEETTKELMNLAFQRVINNESPNNFLSKLEIPKQQEYSLLQNQKSVFQYFLDEEDLTSTYNDFLELKKMKPNSKEINYNLVSLKFKLWLIGDEKVDPAEFEKEIKALGRIGISDKLVNRMLINYNIIQSEIHMFMRDYKAKDRDLKNIFMKYKYINPTSKDLLKLAQYFVAYGKYDWATKLIKPYIGKVDTDEDLLFYYINLTVADSKIVNSSDYKEIILNAIDVNDERFCKLFTSSLGEGVSFQLLDFEVLKKNYCESCN